MTLPASVVTPELGSLRDCFAGRLLTGENETAPFLTDWRGRWHGRALAVVQPDTAADVASVVAWCSKTGVKVVPQGGNTGLAGGSVPDRSGGALVVSLTRLNRIRALDAGNATMIVEAGCILRDVQLAAEQAGLLFPLSLAAEGSCTIGGNLSTNAGGVHVLRYGNARELCLGLEVVDATGEIWDGLRALRKDNTGYDLRDVFVGSEGTLGIITACVLKLFPRPAQKFAAFVAVPSPGAALQLLQLARGQIGAGLTAFELMADFSLDLVLRHQPGSRNPLAARSPWYVLAEVSVWSGDDDHTPLLAVLEQALAEGVATDATVSSSVAQFEAIWALREAVSDAQSHEGSNIRHDISLPASGIADFLRAAADAVQTACPGTRPVVFGHLGDGNLHYNLLPPPERRGAEHASWFLGFEPALNRAVHDLVMRSSGSVSAEHGLGILRRDEAARYKSAVELKLMRAIKSALDPLGTMNPGKVLREQTGEAW